MDNTGQQEIENKKPKDSGSVYYDALSQRSEAKSEHAGKQESHTGADNGLSGEDVAEIKGEYDRIQREKAILEQIESIREKIAEEQGDDTIIHSGQEDVRAESDLKSAKFQANNESTEDLSDPVDPIEAPFQDPVASDARNKYNSSRFADTYGPTQPTIQDENTNNVVTIKTDQNPIAHKPMSYYDNSDQKKAS